MRNARNMSETEMRVGVMGKNGYMVIDLYGHNLHTGEWDAGNIVESDLTDSSDPGDDLAVAMEAVERLVLAHACAGVNVESERYVIGFDTAVEALTNELS